MADESIISQNLDSSRNKKAEQPNKKFKKKRSIRFSRVSSLKPSSRRFNSGLNLSPFDLCSDHSSLQQSSSVASSDSTPNYINNSSSTFVEKKGGSECDDANSMVSSSSGSTDHILQPSAVILSDDGAEAQNSHSKELSDASFNNSRAKGFSEGRKTPIVRNPKVLIKKVSFKPNIVSKKSAQMNEEEAYVDRATCSSIIKDARFPEHIELQPGEKGSDRISSAKVCHYHHCSLNDHCHNAHTPVKKFPFRRRKPAKPLMNTKSNVASGPRAKISADRKEPKKPETTDSVGASSNKHTLKKNDKSKDSKGINQSEVTAKGPDGLDQEPYLKSKSSENIPSDIARNLSSGGIDESIKDSNVMYSAPDSYSSRLSLNDEESRSNQKSEQVLFESTRAGDLENLSSLKVQSPQFRREKHITMWHLIHKQMISSLAEEGATNTPKTVLRANEEKELKETKQDTPDGNYYASPSDSDATIKNIEEGNREMEIHKLFAIKLVREAIEKILLPELQDQSSETQSITSDITDDQQLPKENHLEDFAEDHENHSTDNNGNSAASDVLGVVARTNDSIDDPANNKSETRKVKSEKKSPSNWSSLKKWILLQRFIKQLEKVRKLKPRNPSNLPLETDPVGEKVYLRSQTVDEKKRSEEWMLDYAIRQVLGQLAPTQKRKVALLVKAFETIVPPQDDYSTQVSWPQGERHESVILTSKVDAPEDMKPEAQGKVMPKPNVDVQLSNGIGHQIHGSMANDAQFPEKSAEFTRSLHENVPPTEESQQQINSQSLHENVPPTEESQQQINSQKMYSLSTGNLLDDYEPYSNLEKRDEASSTIRSTTCDIDVKPKVTEETELEQPEITKENLEIMAEEKRMKYEAEQTNNVAEETSKAAGYSTLLQESTARNDRGTQLKPERTLSHESSLDSRLKRNEKGESQLDKENYIIMWHMIYQHVASNIASKVGSHLLGGEEDKKVKDFNTSSDIVTSSPQVISTEESHAAAMEKSDFSKSDAVKLIQEAVDEILLHDVPDDDASDTQSVASETTPDLYLYEKNRDEVLYKSVSNTSVLNEEYVREFDRSDSGISVEETKATLPKPKSWRKLKRLMLLKRSIKAMERARTLKSLLPRKNLPMPSDAEPERVDLKHQIVNERKKAEKWMLDYAVRNIVSELTPARKTRVAMLVEAFEAVVPLPEI